MSQPDCPTCDGTGFDIVDDGAVSMARPCPCDATAREPLKLAGVPERERTYTLAALPKQHHAALADARAAVERGESVLLVGPPARAKSAVSVLLLREAAERGRSIAWRVLSDWLDDIRDTYNRAKGEGVEVSERELLREIIAVDVLAVDDIGVGKPTEFVVGKVTSLVSGRDSTLSPTLYSSNLPLDEPTDAPPYRPGELPRSLETFYGERVHSRLKRCLYVPMVEGHDLRDRRLASVSVDGPDRRLS